MKKVCLIVPDLQVSKVIANELLDIGIMNSQIHVLGKALDKIDDAKLLQASLIQTTDLVPSLKRGALLGLILAASIYILFYFTLPKGYHLGNLALIGIVVFGMFFGLWASAMVGIGIKKNVVLAAENEIKQGHYLLMVDVPKERVDSVTEQILKKHADVHIAPSASEFS